MGYIEAIDRPHEVLIEGSIVYPGYVEVVGRPHEVSIEGTLSFPLKVIDRPHEASIYGYIVVDSTSLPTDQTFIQNAIIGFGDMTTSLKDWTYADGSQNIDGTWVDGTFQYRWFDPEWIFYSIYYRSYDNTSDYSLVGYKYREPVRSNVGEYYSSMVVPDQPGHYENRWTYRRDNSSYSHEIVQPFVSMSQGINYMPDYPDTSGGDST